MAAPPPTSTTTTTTTSSPVDLRAQYLKYIEYVNTRPLTTLSPFFASGTVYVNDTPLSQSECDKMIQGALVKWPELKTEPEMIVVDQKEKRVASRIRLSWRREAGKELDRDGREHLIYQFNDEGKITKVWSMMEGMD